MNGPDDAVTGASLRQIRLTEEIKQLIRQQGFVATVRPDGTPRCPARAPPACGTTNTWCFCTLNSPGTVANLALNTHQGEGNAVDPIRRKGYRFAGTARVLRQGPSTRRS